MMRWRSDCPRPVVTRPEYIPFELPSIRTFTSLLAEIAKYSAVRLSLGENLEEFNHGQPSSYSFNHLGEKHAMSYQATR